MYTILKDLRLYPYVLLIGFSLSSPDRTLRWWPMMLGMISIAIFVFPFLIDICVIMFSNDLISALQPLDNVLFNFFVPLNTRYVQSSSLLSSGFVEVTVVVRVEWFDKSDNNAVVCPNVMTMALPVEASGSA